MKKILCFTLLFAFLSLTSFASSIKRITLTEMQAKANLIVLAKVTKVVTEGDNDHVTIKIDSYLKGEGPQSVYTITLCSHGGLKDFDPALKEGDTGVFFLKRSKQEGEVEKAYWGSVATFNKPNYVLTEKKDFNQPEEENAFEQTVLSADYKVYSDTLQQLGVGKSDIPKNVLVIKIETILGTGTKSAEVYPFIKDKFDELIEDNLINEFAALNSKSAEIQNKFDKTLNVILISKESVDKIFNPIEGGWKRFYSEYPHSSGIIGFSKVAFNADKTKALLYYEDSFDSGKGGVGYYILLKKQEDKWVIQKKVMCWIA